MLICQAKNGHNFISKFVKVLTMYKNFIKLLLVCFGYTDWSLFCFAGLWTLTY